MSFRGFRKWSLGIAEAIDAYRIVPRLILIAYGWLVWQTTDWFMSVPTYTSKMCDSSALRVLLDEGVALDKATDIACSIGETLGGPTGEQTMFISIIVGLSSAVIGLYLSTGKTSKWQAGVVDRIDHEHLDDLSGHNRYPGLHSSYGHGRPGGDPPRRRPPRRRSSGRDITGSDGPEEDASSDAMPESFVADGEDSKSG